jgi:predicted GIY-YIG superfamily endonuclease
MRVFDIKDDSMPLPTLFHYVYILKSQTHPNQNYIGVTSDLANRLQVHNQGGSRHTKKHRPWSVETAVAFNNSTKAIAFEKYLKTGSGRAFAKRHF